jgi:hypothetical protein
MTSTDPSSAAETTTKKERRRPPCTASADDFPADVKTTDRGRPRAASLRRGDNVGVARSAWFSWSRSTPARNQSSCSSPCASESFAERVCCISLSRFWSKSPEMEAGRCGGYRRVMRSWRCLVSCSSFEPLASLGGTILAHRQPLCPCMSKCPPHCQMCISRSGGVTGPWHSRPLGRAATMKTVLQRRLTKTRFPCPDVSGGRNRHHVAIRTRSRFDSQCRKDTRQKDSRPK